jgi:hypothetical protein
VFVGDLSTEGIFSSNRAVVRALGSGEPILGPANRSLVQLINVLVDDILLLDAKPGLLVCPLFENFSSEVSEVVWSGHQLELLVHVKGLTQDQDMVFSSEGVSAVGDWFKVNL